MYKQYDIDRYADLCLELQDVERQLKHKDAEIMSADTALNKFRLKKERAALNRKHKKIAQEMIIMVVSCNHRQAKEDFSQK